MHHFKAVHKLPISLEEAWDFFSSPNNLKLITPPHMTLVPLSEIPERMYPGAMIVYTVRPVAKIPMTWVTEITHIKEREYFIDEQRVGPYSIWHHEHHFKEIEGGVEMTDILWYQVPLGPLGKIVNSIFVRGQVENIFKYREGKLNEMFGKF